MVKKYADFDLWLWLENDIWRRVFSYFYSSGNTHETERIVLFIAVDLHLD